MAGRKSDFTLPTNTLDDLFSTQEERDEAKLQKSGIFRLLKSTVFPTTLFRYGKMRICFSLWKVSKSVALLPLQP